VFNFLNSTVLIAATAALIPLLIQLFSKRRVKVVEFSSLKHLKEMQKRQVRRLKIRQLLLLLLRMLIILMVVLAFARPTTEGGNVGSHASVSAVVLLDNSASMNRFVRDGNLFELARNRVGDLLATFGESDEVKLIPLARSSRFEETPRFASAAVAAEQLSRIAPGYQPADLQGAIDRAADLVADAANLNKEIYIVSDRQRVSLPDSGLAGRADAHVYLVNLPLDESDNCGVTGLDFGGRLLIPGHDFEVVATVRNYAPDERNDLIASLFLDGRRVSQSDLAVPGSGEAAIRFTASVTRGGFHSGWVELSDDRFPTDNRRYFAFRIPEQFNVLIVTGDAAAQYVALALTPSTAINQYWSVKTVAPEELGNIDLAGYDVIMLAGAPDIADAYTERIKAAVRRGTSLFVTYGGTTDIDRFNDSWSDVTGVVFDEAARKDFSRAGFYTIETMRIEHPVFSVFSFENGQPPELKFYTLPKLHTTAGARTLAQFSGNRPALVETIFGRGRVLTFSGPMGPAYSDITGHAFFVPFVSRVAEYLASDLSGYDLELYVRESISRNVAIRGSLSGSMELVAPDSSRYYLAPEDNNGSLILRARPTDLPGTYEIRYRGEPVDRFAVNVDPDECDLGAVDADQFAAAIGADQYHELEPEQDLAGVIAEFRYGKELWQLFLWIAICLLAAEMLLSRGALPEE